MASKTYIVKIKPPALGGAHTVTASTVETHDEHLIFCDSEGRLAGLFLLEVVEGWSELPTTKSVLAWGLNLLAKPRPTVKGGLSMVERCTGRLALDGQKKW
jgi:hypothetical protein